MPFESFVPDSSDSNDRFLSQQEKDEKNIALEKSSNPEESLRLLEKHTILFAKFLKQVEIVQRLEGTIGPDGEPFPILSSEDRERVLKTTENPAITYRKYWQEKENTKNEIIKILEELEQLGHKTLVQRSRKSMATIDSDSSRDI